VTPADRRALERVRREVARRYPAIADAILRAVRSLQSVSLADIERALARGGAAAVIQEIFSESRINSELAEARLEILNAVQASGVSAVRNVLPTVTFGFDVLAPQVLQSVNEMATISLGKFSRDVQDSIRAEVRQSLIDGENPRATARRIREAVGLAPNQQQAVQHFREALQMIDGRNPLDYKLRDKRFDAAIRAARAAGEPIRGEQLARMVDAYRRRFVSFHAETIARTTALDANKLGQELAFQQAEQIGLIEPGRMVKRWVTTLDGRERASHRAMNEAEVYLNDPWFVDGNPQMYPGEGEYNCRCAQVFRLLPRGRRLPPR
jgi:hypothetical protein